MIVDHRLFPRIVTAFALDIRHRDRQCRGARGLQPVGDDQPDRLAEIVDFARPAEASVRPNCRRSTRVSPTPVMIATTPGIASAAVVSIAVTVPQPIVAPTTCA